MNMGKDIWAVGSAPANAKIPKFASLGNVQQILAAATASQRKEKSLKTQMAEAERDAHLKPLKTPSEQEVQDWLQNLKKRKHAKTGRPFVNDKQFEMVRLVADRVVHEMKALADPSIDLGEPLRWCLHGGPGTGKSHVIKVVKELFKDVFHWDIGVEYQIVALQAVMADLLGGDTIHHACGIPVFSRKGECHQDDVQKHMQIVKRVLQWRLFIIDEISMVSAKLLADMDMKLRQVVRDIGTMKTNTKGLDRPFGGLNVLSCGDWCQLPPPDGGFLGSIPVEFIQRARQYKASPSISHGQALMWGGAEGGFQGISELEDKEQMYIHSFPQDTYLLNITKCCYNAR
jgi:hypothetical protein